MTITIGSTTFDRIEYDAGADVVYLHVGDPASAVRFDESPEGHALRFDREGSLVGITIVNAKRLLDDTRPIAITVPERLTVDPATLASVVPAA
jgi:uncharacterized protein YuzE